MVQWIGPTKLWRCQEWHSTADAPVTQHNTVLRPVLAAGTKKTQVTPR